VNIHTVKPLDAELVMKIARSGVKCIFTAEDHNVIGGLGSAVAEVLAQNGSGVRLVRLGVQDTTAKAVRLKPSMKNMPSMPMFSSLNEGLSRSLELGVCRVLIFIFSARF